MGDVMRKFPAQPGPSGGDGGGSNALNSFMSLMSGEKGDYFATHPLLTEALSGCEDSCDVIGLNYLTGRHVLEHELHPHKAVLGTETYPADIVRLWRIVEENPHMIGDFTWAGYDYLGEAGCGIFHYDGGANFSSIYPERTAYIGDLDLLGNRRPISYMENATQAWWDDVDMLCSAVDQLSAGDRLRSAEGTLSGSAANGTQRSDLQQNALDVQG